MLPACMRILASGHGRSMTGRWSLKPPKSRSTKISLLKHFIERRATSSLTCLGESNNLAYYPLCLKLLRFCHEGRLSFHGSSLTDERTNLALRGRVSERGVVFRLFAAPEDEDPGYPVVLPQPID